MKVRGFALQKSLYKKKQVTEKRKFQQKKNCFKIEANLEIDRLNIKNKLDILLPTSAIW